MTAFVALLRAVNVGGTGKLSMSDLKDLCEALGFGSVKTYIASGNVVFTSRKSEAAVKKALEARLEAYAGKPVGVLVRTAAEMAQVLSDNPFPKAAPNRTMAVFLDRAPPSDTLAGIRGRKERRRDRTRSARDLHPLWRGHGEIETRRADGKVRDGAQPEYSRRTRQDGGRFVARRTD